MSGVLTLPANEVGPSESSPRPARVRMLTSPQGGERVVYYEGERIYFRPIEVEDEPRLRGWINDPAVRRYLLHRPPLNAAREREWIESQGKSATDYVFGITVRQGDRLIGTTGLHRIDTIARSAVFGLYIGDKAFQGRGYGKEATRLAL
ncbi:MAG TPA: GNAT family N-acetyltransferase, partial [Anaerolineae bacterium]